MRATRWFPWLLAALCAGSILLSACFAWITDQARLDALRETRTERLDALVHRLEADATVFDLALRDAASQSRHETNGMIPVGILEHPLTKYFITFTDVLNEAGDVIASSRPNVSRSANFASRDYFFDRTRSASDALFVGRPFGLAGTHGVTIPLTRRLTGSNGAFAGVVVAGVRQAWLQDPLNEAGLTGVTIRRADGVILARAPFNPDDIGRTNPGAAGQPRPIAGTSLTLDAAPIEPGPSAAVWLTPALAALPALGCLVLCATIARLRRHTARITAGAARDSEERLRLMATMSHELRTPLTGILGQADLLREEGGLHPRQADRLDRMREAGHLMRAIIDRVIGVSAPEARSIVPVLAIHALDPLIRTCAGIVEAAARDKGLDLRVEIDPSAPGHALLDGALVEQVLINLLMNAVKFTGSGHVTLRMPADPAALRFEVGDTGPGIDRAARGRLFRAYERLGRTSADSSGDGLGLSIARRIVAVLGGAIGHRDNPGGGSVFWFTVPFVPPPIDPPDCPKPAPHPVRTRPRGMRILLTDDMLVTRAVTADHLRSAGHVVTEVEDGESALRAIETGSFDLLLTDMRMPGWDGIETARRIRALPGPNRHIPIVLLTADLNARQRAATADPAIDLCVMKPFRREELLEAIAAVASLPPPVPPLIDDAILAQITESAGPAEVASHLAAAARRIDSLLVCLEDPAPMLDPDDQTAHDLIGMAGLLGLAALAERLRAFDQAADRRGQVQGLRETALETSRALRRRRETGEGP
jgi:signal transduction histidine kinase/CheY-like chemotaxis protein